MPTTPPALAYATRIEQASIAGNAPVDHEVADLLRALHDALLAATAYVELDTGNGTREQPPAWAVDADGAFNPERIAARCRRVLQHGVAAVAAAGKDGHERARAQRAAVASATGDQARAMRGKRELRAALEGLPERSNVRATLLWVLGEVEELPA